MARMSIGLAIAVLISGCAILRDNDIPAGYHFPRHPGSGEGPTAGVNGILDVRDGCFYVGEELIVWPETYSMDLDDGHVVVAGDGLTVSAGDVISAAGGSLDNDLPDSVFGTSATCAGPYLWLSKLEGVSAG